MKYIVLALKALPQVETSKTILLDAQTLAHRTEIGNTDLKWSPDSRYLLNKKATLACGLGTLSGVGTLELVDAQTHKRTEVESSSCLVDRNTVGWLNREIHP